MIDMAIVRWWLNEGLEDHCLIHDQVLNLSTASACPLESLSLSITSLSISHWCQKVKMAKEGKKLRIGFRILLKPHLGHNRWNCGSLCKICTVCCVPIWIVFGSRNRTQQVRAQLFSSWDYGTCSQINSRSYSAVCLKNQDEPQYETQITTENNKAMKLFGIQNTRMFWVQQSKKRLGHGVHYVLYYEGTFSLILLVSLESRWNCCVPRASHLDLFLSNQ